jgi:GT2 family glycosyltransferase
VEIAVLIACHNRRDKTLRCLKALFESHLPRSTTLSVFLVDDGSSDGTAEAIRAAYPQVRILQGDGSLYWTGGMNKAFSAAIEHNFDYYLWLNDDTYLYPKTIEVLLKVDKENYIKTNKSAVVVGSTQEQEGGQVNHGGVVVNGSWWKSHLVEPGIEPVVCDTLNGNCVLVARGVVQVIGILDSKFIHTMGDIDYGFRVTAARLSLIVMPGFAGICHSNPIANTYEDETLPLRKRISMIADIKGRPLKLWFIFLWRHFGYMGLFYWVGTYAKVVLTWLLASIRYNRMFWST